MAIRSFAIPLSTGSKQTGDITIEALKNAGADVLFKLTNISSGMTNSLNLKTSSGGTVKNHVYTLTVAGGVASTLLSAANVSALYTDANGGDWDYVQAEWTVGGLDTPGASGNYQVQNGQTYDSNGWPPKEW